ncbi:FRMD8, partial [Cordylochernes scorpioides]
MKKIEQDLLFDSNDTFRIVLIGCVQLEEAKILELLYHEAKLNVLEGKYPCPSSDDCEMLAAIQARIELGHYNPDLHTPTFFKYLAFISCGGRNKLHDWLPAHCLQTRWFWLPGLRPKQGQEHRILDRFREIPASTPVAKLVRRYLEFCWTLPYYGAAMFPGQVERCVRGVATLFNHPDIPVLVAINREGVHLIDQSEPSVLLSLHHKELSWKLCPSPRPQSPHCLPSLLLQFQAPSHLKLLQVFSHQKFYMVCAAVFTSAPCRKNPGSLARLSLVTLNEQGT